MSTKMITSEDLLLLQQLFRLPTNAVIYDPKQVLSQNSFTTFPVFRRRCDFLATRAPLGINLSGEFVRNNPFEFLLEFNKTVKGIDRERFYYVNNPDGSMRWIFPDDASYPGFLNLYNSQGWKARLFKTVFQWYFKLGQAAQMASGSFTLRAPKSDYAKQSLGSEHSGYSIFTGTVGPNRKAIIELNDGQRSTHFVKVPLSDRAHQLIDNEASILAQLSTKTWRHLALPKPQPAPRGLQLTNIKPAAKLQANDHFGPFHQKALQEMYEHTQTLCSIQQLAGWSESQTCIDDLRALTTTSNDLSLRQVQQLTAALAELKTSIDAAQLIPVALGHGDFTPWNMYLTGDNIHLYDWELAQEQLPTWYDAFHFIIQTHILIKKSNASEILKSIRQLESSIADPQLDFHLHFKLYLLFNCSYYLKMYSQQSPLHQQAHWLVDTWQALVAAAQQARVATLTTTS